MKLTILIFDAESWRFVGASHTTVNFIEPGRPVPAWQHAILNRICVGVVQDLAREHGVTHYRSAVIDGHRSYEWVMANLPGLVEAARAGTPHVTSFDPPPRRADLN